MSQYSPFILSVAQKLVENADQVRIDEQVQADGSIALRLHVASEDLGKIIGKEGKTARSMRTLLSVMARQKNETVTLEIVE